MWVFRKRSVMSRWRRGRSGVERVEEGPNKEVKKVRRGRRMSYGLRPKRRKRKKTRAFGGSFTFFCKYYTENMVSYKYI